MKQLLTYALGFIGQHVAEGGVALPLLVADQVSFTEVFDLDDGVTHESR